jgi:ribonuclease P protein component
VDRNTCKRIAREAFREFAADLAGLDVVVICRTVVAPKERSRARNELNGMLPQLAVHDGAREAPSAARGRAE